MQLFLYFIDEIATLEPAKLEDLLDSDPDIEFIEKDSGMSSLSGSKDDTPERKTEDLAAPPAEEEPEPTTNSTVQIVNL